MRNVISMVPAAAFAAALAVPVLAGVAADMTVKGEVADVACSTSKKEAGKGAGHANCAMSCAKGGQPVGILTADAVYTVVGDYAANKNAKLLDFIDRNVIVSGEATEKDGVKSINVNSIKLAN